MGELIGIINSGYRYGATRPVLIPVKGGGWEASEMSTYAPVVMAVFWNVGQAANGGPPFVRDGSRRMSSWPAFCGGREQFAAVGGVGERKLTERADIEGWYTPVSIEDYRNL